MAITDWPLQERPRERLLALGPGALADAELLAILLRTGAKGKSAVDLARELLGRYGSVSALSGGRDRREGPGTRRREARSAQGRAGARAPRPPGGNLHARRPHLSQGGARLPAPRPRRAGTGGVRRPAPRCTAPGHRHGRTVPRDAD